MKLLNTLAAATIIGCGAPTAEVKTESPTVAPESTQSEEAKAGIYRFIADTCAEQRRALGEDIYSRIGACLCEPVGEEREACLEDQGVPLHEEDYNPFIEVQTSEEICQDELATKNGVSFKEAQAANRIVQAKKLKNQYLNFVGGDTATFSYEDAQAYVKLLQEMHAERMFDHEDALETLDIVDRNSFINKYIKALRQTFLDKGHYEEASILEWLTESVAAPAFHSMMGEAITINGYLTMPPGPECGKPDGGPNIEMEWLDQ